MKKLRILSIISGFLLITFSSKPQQPGIREVTGGGYTFDAEKYKVDMMKKQTESYSSKYQIPSRESAKDPAGFEKANESYQVEYKPPKYPLDTVSVEVSRFRYTCTSYVISPAEWNLALSEAYKEPEFDTLILKNEQNSGKTRIFRLEGLGHFTANRELSVLFRKSEGSDRSFYGLVVNVTHSPQYYNYKFMMDNLGNFTIDAVYFHGTYKKQKHGRTDAYKPCELNELTIRKTGNKLSFLCNNVELWSVQTEHPWAHLAATDPLIYLDENLGLTLFGYRDIYFPE